MLMHEAMHLLSDFAGELPSSPVLTSDLVVARDRMCPTLTCTSCHDERRTGSVGERPVNFRIETH